MRRRLPACASRWAVAVAGWTTCHLLLSRSLRHVDIYLKGYADGREAHSGVAEWFRFYSNTRPRQELD
jgi:hypothetical protein